MKIIIAVIACLSAQITSACDYVDFGLYSYHWDREQDYNETNSGIGCENIIGEIDVLYFENSHYEDAFLISNFKELKKKWGISWGYDYGVVFGYEISPAPIIMPKFEYAKFGFKVSGYLLFKDGVAAKFSKRFW